MVIATSVPALGYCAPVIGPGRPDPDAVAAAWKVAADGAWAKPVALDRVVPSGPTILGGLFAPPADRVVGEEDAGGWPPGRYVFDVAGHWFGAEIELVVASFGGRSPPPTLVQ